MKKAFALITLFVTTAIPLASRASTIPGAIIQKRDFGPVVYAEDFYRLYSIPAYYSEDDLLANIDYLQQALKAPFDFVHRAITIVETREERRLYVDILHMQFNYLLTQNFVYLAAQYDKQTIFYYNAQFAKELREAYDIAEVLYNEAEKYWRETERLARRVRRSREYIELDLLIDRAHRIDRDEIDYRRTIVRKLREIEQKRAQLDALE